MSVLSTPKNIKIFDLYTKKKLIRKKQQAYYCYYGIAKSIVLFCY